MLINVPVSIGELFDKISILDIKTKKIKNKNDLKLIKYELSKLKKIVKSKGLTSTKIKRKYLCLLYTSPSPRDRSLSRMPSSA